MASEESRIEALAAAIADGRDIDWDLTESSADSDQERAVLGRLHQLEIVARAARTLTARWGAFEIRSEIGSGTFGTVYRAWYQQLECEVALKLLNREHARVKEACLLAQIRHPNVVSVLGADTVAGRTGIWMELVSGQTLKTILQNQGPFGPDEAALIGRDLCRALAAVHQKQILHGDIKPQNVMREAGGRTVLMDFGAGDASLGEPNDRSLAGSPAYLAPELLSGGQPTVRSDLYSLGVLLYHLVTGGFPVTAASLDSLRRAHAAGQRQLLRDARPDLPSAFLRAIDRATAADPAERPESAGALERLLEEALGVRAAGQPGPVTPGNQPTRPSRESRGVVTWLKWGAAAMILVSGIVATWLALSPGPPSGGIVAPGVVVRSITVAPLELHGTSAERTALAAAMTADLAASLESPGVTVKGRALPLTGGAGDTITQASHIGADAVVQGSVSIDGETFRLDMAVVDTQSRRSVWRRSYTAISADVPLLPRLIAKDIAGVLSFGPPASARRPPTAVSLIAYDHFARGKQLAEQREPAPLLRGIEQFEEAIRLEPSYAPAWAGLASAWIALGVPAFGPLRPFEARGRAREAALKALDLDADLPEAHTALAFLSYFHDWNWPAADERFQRALRLNPNYAEAHHWYADYLNAMGRFDEAMAHITAACELEPLSILYQRDVAWHLFFQRRYPEAIAQLRSALSREPTYAPAISLLGRSLVANGDVLEGIDELRRLDLAKPANAAMLAYAYAAAGDRPNASAWLARVTARESVEYVSPYSVALVEAAQGHRDRAMQQLTRAFQEQDSTIVNVKVDPRFDVLRGDARFTRLLAQLRFPEAAGPAGQ